MGRYIDSIEYINLGDFLFGHTLPQRPIMIFHLFHEKNWYLKHKMQNSDYLTLKSVKVTRAVLSYEHTERQAVTLAMTLDARRGYALYQGDASWWTAEGENDRISLKKTNYIKSTLLSFLKVCLYGYYTNCQFYQISLFHQLNIVFHKISENHFFKDCILNFT